jgi:hypothetical protein
MARTVCDRKRVGVRGRRAAVPLLSEKTAVKIAALSYAVRR